MTSVHILATCNNVKLLHGTLLVFRSLRVGFPTAPIFVHVNALPRAALEAVRSACDVTGCTLIELDSRITHDDWIKKLVEFGHEPFWICDTDVVFWEAVQEWNFGEDAFLAGRYEPAFMEPWTKSHKISRLHTALMWIDPVKLNAEMGAYLRVWQPRSFPFSIHTPFIAQTFIPRCGAPPLFYDTCAGLYQAIGGTMFTDAQNTCFEHMHCGCYADKIDQYLTGIKSLHEAVYADLNAAKGLYNTQQKYYEDHKI